MGFLDRFKSGPSAPDALTVEVAARLRALPTVDEVDAVDADSVVVRWTGDPTPRTVDLAALRPAWKQAGGFDRIELMDAFVEGLAPGAGTTADAPPAPVDPEPTTAPADDGWERIRTRVLPVLTPTGAGPSGVRWPVGGGVDATVVADGTPVDQADCERWGVGELDVRAAATANLGEIDPAPEPIGPDARAWVPTAPSGQQSCWLTAPARLLEALGLDEGIAFAPLRGELVVVDPADAELVQTIAASTQRIVAEQPDPLTSSPFLIGPAGTRLWEPPG